MSDNRTTELLRELLDERGIEWKADDTDVLLHTVWHNENGQLVTHFEPIGDDCGGFTSEVSLYDCTPEQAIAVTLGSEREVELQSALYEVSDKWAQAQIEAEDYARENLLLRAKLDSATLGNGMLTAEHVEKAIRDCSTYASYDGCTYYASGIRLQAIADELNAKLGSGTCEPNWVLQGKTQTQEFWRCECGNCGKCFGVESRESFPFKVTIDKVDIPNFCPNCGKAVKR